MMEIWENCDISIFFLLWQLEKKKVYKLMWKFSFAIDIYIFQGFFDKRCSGYQSNWHSMWWVCINNLIFFCYDRINILNWRQSWILILFAEFLISLLSCVHKEFTDHFIDLCTKLKENLIIIQFFMKKKPILGRKAGMLALKFLKPG